MYSSKHLLHPGHQKIHLATWKFAQVAQLATQGKKLKASPRYFSSVPLILHTFEYSVDLWLSRFSS